MTQLQLPWPVQTLSNAASLYWPNFSVEVVPQLDSTNTTLMERGRMGNTAPVLLVCEQQTAGKGRMGRQWHSARTIGGTLTFSLGLPLPKCDLSGLSLVVACSVVNSLDARQQHRLRIKWPNDLWYANSKLGGILVELSTRGEQCYVVIGVGINIAEPPNFARPTQQQAAPQPPAWVQQFWPDATAPAVLAQIAVPLIAAIREFASTGFTPWQSRFAERDALLGQTVSLSNGRVGVAQGVDQQGTLQLQTGQEIYKVLNDEVSVRLQACL